MAGSAEYPVIVGGGPSSHSIQEAKTSAEHALGTIGRIEDRTFVYCSNTTANILTTGHLHIATAPIVGHVEQVIGAAAAVGDTTISYTPITNNITENQYAGGYAYCNKVGNIGEIYKIERNAAITAAATGLITLATPIHTAIGATVEVTLMASPYLNPAKTTTLGVPVGIPVIDVPAGNVDQQWCWLQCGGPAAVICTATPAVGQPVAQDNAGTAGNVIVNTALLRSIGNIRRVGVAAEANMVDLTIRY